MKIALVGSDGYIAEFLIKKFQEDKNILSILKIDKSCSKDTSFLDLAKAGEFDYGILKDIDMVIFTAAISEPDKCALDFETCWKVNVEGTKYFIHRAMEMGCRILFFSSDAVFGDIPGNIYVETSETKALTVYGKMKKAVEDEFNHSPYVKAIRLSYVVSAKDRFVSYCIDSIKQNKIADIFHPFYRNCIVASDVVKTVEWFVYHFDNYRPFAFNVAGKELVSRVRIADEINRIMGYRLQYRVLQPKGDFFANRPMITQMKSLYAHKYGILEENTFTEKIQKELEEITI